MLPPLRAALESFGVEPAVGAPACPSNDAIAACLQRLMATLAPKDQSDAKDVVHGLHDVLLYQHSAQQHLPGVTGGGGGGAWLA